ncbi:2-C-methyl-D-erythritol 4-phosphate cytidylyltransferase [Candidatus Chlamydia sanziniae]|uniref:2-C-methyl-D-erythritol 4-phosphate cytidylyltransferase n=1 Tax=Candidatus Chlamydia sanziniae TaxID=1806891 RepID=A0A1A9HTR1_9CHLA|nr:2-C-methyl-D-erythritol 4-phosphate cytidylyltransferase [Candidatus Chlamydia sanziniae]ANH78379.1 2-C-methyl-D-erythritol 4-phosphate cytidylyltransferase [Candidatus Chlamydia sanziniae]
MFGVPMSDKHSLILLSGGQGRRFGSSTPKQYLPFYNKPLILHSLATFSTLSEIAEIIVVCAPMYREIFGNYTVTFAEPGERRQDSVFSGLHQVSHPWVLVHDGVRPFVYPDEITELILAAKHSGAATLASPLPYTIKQRSPVRTLDRDALAIIHTPQCIKTEILSEGLLLAMKKNLTLPDDTGAAELLGYTPQLVFNKHPQLKISYPEDLTIAHALL